MCKGTLSSQVQAQDGAVGRHRGLDEVLKMGPS